MENTGSGIVGLIIGLIGSIGIAFIKDIWSKGKEHDKEIKIAEIHLSEEEHKQLKQKLKEALDTCKSLQDDLKIERDRRIQIEYKFDIVKQVYKVIFTQYAMQFKDDPEQLGLLKSLDDIINS
jgi:5-bromo-4-chloroindolyl phosphate hydrolysis protein